MAQAAEKGRFVINMLSFAASRQRGKIPNDVRMMIFSLIGLFAPLEHDHGEPCNQSPEGCTDT